MWKNQALCTVLFGGLLAAIIMLWIQQVELTEIVAESKSDVQRLERIVMRSETKPRSVTVDEVAEESDVRPTSPSELHKPKGPMPRSILVKSEPQAGEPARGVDLTSGIRRRAIEPCEAPCRRLADCALERTVCPAMDTQNQGVVVDICIAACRGSERVAKRIIGGTECAPSVTYARLKIDGFEALCDSK